MAENSSFSVGKNMGTNLGSKMNHFWKIRVEEVKKERIISILDFNHKIKKRINSSQREERSFEEDL